MKKILFLLLFISAAVLNNSTAQIKGNKLIGVWQVGSTIQGDAWSSNYRFFNNGTFMYTFDQYDDRGRIINAKGAYKLKGDTLSLIIKQEKKE